MKYFKYIFIINSNVNLKAKLVLLLGIGFNFILSSNSFGQSPPDDNLKIFPPSPTASALGKYGEIPVNYYTGIPSINIPLYELPSKPSLPISLSYHSGGIKVEDRASWVGLGFSLNAGGVITRTIKGGSDCGPYGYYSPTIFSKVNVQTPFTFTELEKHEIAQGFWDTEPDIIYFNLGGKSGRIIYIGDDSFITSPAQDIKIEANRSSNDIISWTLTDNDGTIYKFGENYSTEHGDEGISAWYVSSISSPSQSEEIIFNYQEGPGTVIMPMPANHQLTRLRNNSGGSYILANTPAPFVMDMIKLHKITYGNKEVLFNVSDRLDHYKNPNDLGQMN